MKLRIAYYNNNYYIQKRIFKLLKWECWVLYKETPLPFNTVEQAKERINFIKEKKEEKRRNSKTKEILRFDL